MPSNPKAEQHFWCLKEVCNVGLSDKKPSIFFSPTRLWCRGWSRPLAICSRLGALLTWCSVFWSSVAESLTKQNWHSFLLMCSSGLLFLVFLATLIFLTLTFSSDFDWSNVISFFSTDFQSMKISLPGGYSPILTTRRIYIHIFFFKIRLIPNSENS